MKNLIQFIKDMFAAQLETWKSGKPLKTILAIISAFTLAGCDIHTDTSDDIQRKQSEKLLNEGTRQTGMPAIKNFRERKLLKDILELRDQNGLTTYTYIVAEMTGKLVFLGESIGYGISASTQYTNPQKAELYTTNGHYGYNTLPQADPNGLFSPSASEGTWVMMKDPHGDKVVPVYVEPRIIVSPFRLE